MNYCEIKKFDEVNGDGVRVSLFVAGCSFACKGCFNRTIWSYSAGDPYTPDVQEKLFEFCKDPFITGLSLLGGEPLAPKNELAVLRLIKDFRARYPDKNVWVYTGYTKEELIEEGRTEVFDLADVIVDGQFVQELHDENLKYRGSSNQRILVKNIDY